MSVCESCEITTATTRLARGRFVIAGEFIVMGECEDCGCKNAQLHYASKLCFSCYKRNPKSTIRTIHACEDCIEETTLICVHCNEEAESLSSQLLCPECLFSEGWKPTYTTRVRQRRCKQCLFTKVTNEHDLCKDCYIENALKHHGLEHEYSHCIKCARLTINPKLCKCCVRQSYKEMK